MNVSFADLRALAEAADPTPKTPAEKHRRKTIDQMIRLHGAGEGTCGDCAHLKTRDFGRNRYFKCDRCRMSASANTDWRKTWPACGAKESTK
jgi:hypothetical protein